MLEVGDNDVFEGKYTGKFRELAGLYGEIVMYERDRAARDIGIHLTKKSRSGKTTMSSALCWFQLKGKKTSTLSASDIAKSETIAVRLQTQHLKFWYIQPVTTYLVVYLEATDQFLVTDIQKLIKESFPGIMKVTQETMTVQVPTDSPLDDQAFKLILDQSDQEAWKKALQADDESTRLCLRDYQVIWRMGTAKDRNVEHYMELKDWQSKMRGEIYIYEHTIDSEDQDEIIRQHWQTGLSVEDIETEYPYCEYFQQEDEDLENWLEERDEDDEDDDTYIPFHFADNLTLYGVDAAGEWIEYRVGIRLNALGLQLFQSVMQLAETGLIEISDDMADSISVAAFHGRSV